MKSYGKIRLTLRFYDDRCGKKKCGSFCYVIDTYSVPTGRYIGSFYLHSRDEKGAKKTLRNERARWRRAGFAVVR